MEKIHLRKQDRDLFAALLSVLPGAGHLYKHHYLAGLGIMTGGNLLMVFVTALLALATFGLAIILVPAAYVLGVAYAAYELEDWHGKHEHFHPWRDEEGSRD
ncbi:hypothetical protein JO972_15160 [Verrucomicrobiaceae bacterium 5K15]|uniref:Uncharacterized protein n=1 Tax=Oceaniferula flava TaxID=2800421 RepID=A0AAE2SDE3_9BACT|nr:hypothetical protein [Oceaniferula flavus]MBK1856308.1 hypothetical protein [Oceaniferula flavus]MBM1137615.1 hypothetical protein [Oceaniferula flavus]